jgi:hypothetical protein
MPKQAKTRRGTFQAYGPAHTDLSMGGKPDQHVQALVNRLMRSKDDDWTQTGGLIAVRCYEDPSRYRIVVARVVYETEDIRE